MVDRKLSWVIVVALLALAARRWFWRRRRRAQTSSARFEPAADARAAAGDSHPGFGRVTRRQRRPSGLVAAV
jgi:hypothetical protein